MSSVGDPNLDVAVTSPPLNHATLNRPKQNKKRRPVTLAHFGAGRRAVVANLGDASDDDDDDDDDDAGEKTAGQIEIEQIKALRDMAHMAEMADAAQEEAAAAADQARTRDAENKRIEARHQEEDEVARKEREWMEARHAQRLAMEAKDAEAEAAAAEAATAATAAEPRGESMVERTKRELAERAAAAASQLLHQIPAPFLACVGYLLQPDALMETGLFRVSGNAKEINKYGATCSGILSNRPNLHLHSLSRTCFPPPSIPGISAWLANVLMWMFWGLCWLVAPTPRASAHPPAPGTPMSSRRVARSTCWRGASASTPSAARSSS